jgi:hypothetical protein
MNISNESFFGFIDTVLEFYRLAMGDWDFENSGGLWLLFLFILSTLLFPLILMNLLIALMGDTYSRVQDGIIPTDYQLRA